jgi:hypothetical protein
MRFSVCLDVGLEDLKHPKVHRLRGECDNVGGGHCGDLSKSCRASNGSARPCRGVNCIDGWFINWLVGWSAFSRWLDVRP